MDNHDIGTVSQDNITVCCWCAMTSSKGLVNGFTNGFCRGGVLTRDELSVDNNLNAPRLGRRLVFAAKFLDSGLEQERNVLT